MPFDYVKTMLQKQKVDPATGKLPYSGMADCAIKTFAEGGPLKFYTGFPTCYADKPSRHDYAHGFRHNSEV